MHKHLQVADRPSHVPLGKKPTQAILEQLHGNRFALMLIGYLSQSYCTATTTMENHRVNIKLHIKFQLINILNRYSAEPNIWENQGI